MSAGCLRVSADVCRCLRVSEVSAGCLRVSGGVCRCLRVSAGCLRVSLGVWGLPRLI